MGGMNKALQTLAVIVVLLWWGCAKQNPDWTIVRQRGHENYGFVMDTGLVLAGYTNKESARQAMRHEKQFSKGAPSLPISLGGLWERVD